MSGPPSGYYDEAAAPAAAPRELIFKPAKRDKFGLIIGLSGPSWSGKTFSALRLARGIAGPNGRIALLDTENGRGLIYSDDFNFDHGELHEPFSPNRYASGAAMSKRNGHDVLIIDSMSHEHAGPGGVLEMHENELTRLAGNDFGRREAMKMVAWIKPKVAHKAMVQRLLQLNSHLVLCFRAEEKTEIQMLPNKSGKLVNTPVSIGFQPVTSKDMAYELTILLGFDPKRPGVPIAIKLADKFKPFVPLDRVLDESTGARLAAWARGEKPEPFAALGAPAQPQRPAPRPGIASPPPEVPPPEDPPPGDPPPGDPPPGEPPPDERFPGDIPLSGQLVLDGDARPASKPNKNLAVLEELIGRFDAVKVRADHLAIVDQKEARDRIGWFKKNKPDLHARLEIAMKASWARTEKAAA